MLYAFSNPQSPGYELLDLTPKSYKIFPTSATKQHLAPFIIFTKLLELIL